MLHSATRCCYCGGDLPPARETQELIHKNAEGPYLEALAALRKKNFSEVLRLSETLIQWMPQNSEVYWLRFLAKNNAINDEALILSGAVCDDIDYINAERFATDQMRNVYTNVKDAISRLGSLIQKHSKKSAQQQCATLLKSINATRTICQTLYEQLNRILSEIAVLEFQITATVQKWNVEMLETNAILDDAYVRTQKLIKTLESVELRTAEEQFKYKFQIAAQRERSANAKNAIIDSQTNPLRAEYQKIVAEREQKKREYESALCEFQDKKRDLTNLTNSLEHILNTSDELDALLSGNEFAKVRKMIGPMVFQQIRNQFWLT
jgi:hypothetical protein